MILWIIRTGSASSFGDVRGIEAAWLMKDDIVMRSLVLLLALTTVVGVAAVQSPSTQVAAAAENDGPFRVPFKPGEKLTYAAKVNFMSAGTATMSVEGIEMIRDRPTYHTIFNVKGRV